MGEEKFLTTEELCKLFRVTRTTMLRWRNEGMPYHGKGKVLRYKLSEVEEWLKGQTQK